VQRVEGDKFSHYAYGAGIGSVRNSLLSFSHSKQNFPHADTFEQKMNDTHLAFVPEAFIQDPWRKDVV